MGLDTSLDVLYIAELLGHSSPAINQHVRWDRLAGAAQAIADALGG